jgi:hypothetical protein
MVVVGEGSEKLVVHVTPGSSGPWNEPYLSWLRRTALVGLEHGGMVLVVERGRTTLILPDRGVDLGVVHDDERIVLAQYGSESSKSYKATVMKAEEAKRFADREKKSQ